MLAMVKIFPASLAGHGYKRGSNQSLLLWFYVPSKVCCKTSMYRYGAVGKYTLYDEPLGERAFTFYNEGLQFPCPWFLHILFPQWSCMVCIVANVATISTCRLFYLSLRKRPSVVKW